jgi:DNA-binding response OmpR family regulator
MGVRGIAREPWGLSLPAPKDGASRPHTLLGELTARVGAILRRTQPLPEGLHEVVRHGPLDIDLAGRVVRLDGEAVPLTALEFELLRTLAEAPGRVFGRQDLLERLWHRDYAGSDRVVDVHVSNLRQKLAAASATAVIHTVRGVGYTLR